MGFAVIGDVIIDSCPAAAGLLRGIRQPCDVTVVIVAPHQRNVVGQFHAVVVDVEHLLVGYKGLRNVADRAVQLRGEQLPLGADHLVGQGGLLIERHGSGHLAIVNPAHTQRKDIFIVGDLEHPLAPVTQHTRAIGGKIVLAVTLRIPLADVVAHHWLAMRRSDDNPITLRRLPVSRNLVKSDSRSVHRRPDRIGTQAQQQLENPGIGLRTQFSGHTAAFVTRAPRVETPILVVEENTPVLDRGSLRAVVSRGKRHRPCGTGRHVGPPLPGRHAHETRKFQHAVSRTARIAAHDEQRTLSVPGGFANAECLPAAFESLRRHTPGTQQRVETFPFGERPHDNRPGARNLTPTGGFAGHPLRIGGVNRQRGFDDPLSAEVAYRRRTAAADQRESPAGRPNGRSRADECQQQQVTESQHGLHYFASRTQRTMYA